MKDLLLVWFFTSKNVFISTNDDGGKQTEEQSAAEWRTLAHSDVGRVRCGDKVLLALSDLTQFTLCFPCLFCAVIAMATRTLFVISLLLRVPHPLDNLLRPVLLLQW
ncbi:hypothetical protein CBL_03195 [Carabus blaptoides fortunei]